MKRILVGISVALIKFKMLKGYFIMNHGLKKIGKTSRYYRSSIVMWGEESSPFKDKISTDDSGRTIRKRSEFLSGNKQKNKSWTRNNETWEPPRKGWEERYSNRREERYSNRREERYPRRGERSRAPRKREDVYNKVSTEEGKINMRALEEEGLEHIYGLSPVLNALQSKRRDFTAKHEKEDIKSEAQLCPYLFLQEGSSNRIGEKAKQANDIISMADELDIPIARVDKGALNTLSGNRPHQGFVLRSYGLPFDRQDRLLSPDDEDAPLLYLVLDEVVDPQNFGALLRTAYFLGGGQDVKVLTCHKNSAPPSPTVSAASAGALELMNVYSTSNLPRTLSRAKEDGWHILGAAITVDADCYDLTDMESPLQPTVLVLGSEGFGLRTLVARCCSAFVRIQGHSHHDGIDSLNVSVTGAIMMSHLLKLIQR